MAMMSKTKMWSSVMFSLLEDKTSEGTRNKYPINGIKTEIMTPIVLKPIHKFCLVLISNLSMFKITFQTTKNSIKLAKS